MNTYNDLIKQQKELQYDISRYKRLIAKKEKQMDEIKKELAEMSKIKIDWNPNVIKFNH